jgi:hypothetical protein
MTRPRWQAQCHHLVWFRTNIRVKCVVKNSGIALAVTAARDERVLRTVEKETERELVVLK